MRTQDVTALVAAGTHGTLAASAAALGVAQSTVSRRVAALENDLGVRLLERSHVGVELTPAGSAFLPHAQPLLAAVERARAAAAARAPSAGDGSQANTRR